MPRLRKRETVWAGRAGVYRPDHGWRHGAHSRGRLRVREYADPGDLKELKEVRRGRISEYAEKFRCEFHEARTPWSVPCQVAFPSATQNEVDEEAATTLIKNGVIAVGEGANMPCTLEATRAFLNANVLLGPSKAANAGGVAVSGLEQSQNALHLSWSREEVCKRLQQIMSDIHAKCCQFGEDPRGHINYVKSRAPTSLASSRWPTRCSRTARSDGMPRARLQRFDSSSSHAG